MDTRALFIWKILPRGFHIDIRYNNNKVLNVLLKMSQFQCFCEQTLKIYKNTLKKIIDQKFLIFFKYLKIPQNWFSTPNEPMNIIFQMALTPTMKVFSCDEQLKRWRCHSVSPSVFLSVRPFVFLLVSLESVEHSF